MAPLLLLAAACTSVVNPTDTGDTGDCKVFTWYRDEDGDGHGNLDFPTESCDRPANFSPESDDCDDTEKSSWNDCPGWDCIELGTYDHPPEESEDTADTADTADTQPVQTRSTYHGCTLKGGWQEARQRCYNAWPGGDLVATYQIAEFQALQGLAVNLNEESAWWFGVYQESTSPSVDFGWFYVDEGYPEKDTVDAGGIWHIGQPENGGFVEGEGGALEEDVAVYYAVDGVWAVGDTHIDNSLGYVCEVQGTL